MKKRISLKRALVLFVLGTALALLAHKYKQRTQYSIPSGVCDMRDAKIMLEGLTEENKKVIIGKAITHCTKQDRCLEALVVVPQGIAGSCKEIE